MKLQNLLTDLQKDFELKEPFSEDSPGIYAIHVEEGMKVLVSPVYSGIQFTSTVIDAPIGKEEELYLNLLYANLMGQGTRGSLLSLSDEGRKLTLSRVIDYDITFKEFKEILEDFINSIDFWREEALNYQ